MKFNIVSVCLVVIIFLGCVEQSTYRQWVDEELNSGIQKDSLFLGYHFGMTKQEFYDHSWSLNSQRKVRQGSGNQSVVQELGNLKFDAKRNFYPKFHENKIYIMPVTYSYNGWAPWNKEMWSDSLIGDVVDFYEQRYETDFRKMKHPDLNKEAFISIQGNRAITIFREDDQHVTTTFTDLEVMQEVKNNKDDR